MSIHMCVCVCVCVRAQSLSHVRFFVTPWTIARQAPLSMEFSRQKYWTGLPFPPLGDLPHPGTEPMSLALQADSLPLSHWGNYIYVCVCVCVCVCICMYIYFIYIMCNLYIFTHI